MPEINILDKHVAELIAAGEVVERPASVVKELMENSIDAGSSSITVEIKRGGVTYIRITDNGCGIDRSNIKKAFISHATSKISKADDLDSIFTLGFRGEALASVAAVSRVEIMTRAENEDAGTRYCIEGGEETLLNDAGCPEGTTIIVRDIFYNTPARMKFLKKDVTEGNAVAGVVDRIALSHPEICVRFIRDGKEVLVTNGDGNMKNTIFSVFGRDFSQSLIPCSYELNGIKISGFVTKPVNSRPNRTMQFFFLNGRLIKTRTGTAALEAAYKNSIMTGKFPACVLNIQLPAGAVDVNVHPAKTEVRFADEKKVFDAIYYGTKLAVEENDTRPKMSFESKSKIIINSQQMPQTVKAEQIRFNQSVAEFNETKKPVEKSFEPDISVKKESAFFTDEKATVKVKNEPVVFRSDNSRIKEEFIQSDEDILLNNSAAVPEKKEKKESEYKPEPVAEYKTYQEPFRVIGEAFKTYILVEQGNKILVIDKHAAHERMIFNSLKNNEDSVESQLLITPVTVTLSKEEYDAITDNLEILSKAGYEVEDFGQGMVIVTECPAYLEAGDIPDVISELACYLADNKRDIITEKLDWIYHSTACRAAIKAGDNTTGYELEKFTEKLLNDKNVRYCPHGRPVLIEMSKKEIEKSFGRIQ